MAHYHSEKNDDPPGPYRLFHQLVSTSDLSQRDTFGNRETGPSCLQRSIQISRRLGLKNQAVFEIPDMLERVLTH